MVYAHHGQKLLKVGDVAQRLQLGKTKVFELLATGKLESLQDRRRPPGDRASAQ